MSQILQIPTEIGLEFSVEQPIPPLRNIDFRGKMIDQTFKDILFERLNADIQPEFPSKNTDIDNRFKAKSQSNFAREHHEDISQFAWILAHATRLEGRKTSHFPYEKYRKPIRKPTVERPNHLLNESQMNAFNILKSFANTLNLNFSLKELKSNYRLALHHTHPDKGGSSLDFQRVQGAYQTLRPLVELKC